MKYEVGSFVKVLVKRDCAQEGDVGVVDAIHPQSNSYTIGFYAAEDCLMGSARFHEEELEPYRKQSKKDEFEIGDIVETKIAQSNIPEKSIGEILAVYPQTKGVAVEFKKNDGEFPIILPYRYEDVRIIKKKQFNR